MRDSEKTNPEKKNRNSLKPKKKTMEDRYGPYWL